MKAMANISIDYGDDPSPPWLAHSGRLMEIEVKHFNAYECIMELARKLGQYINSKEQNRISFYIQTSSSVSIYTEPGRWYPNKKDIIVENKFYNYGTLITDKDNTMAKFGKEVIRFLQMTDEEPENIHKLDLKDADAIMGL